MLVMRWSWASCWRSSATGWPATLTRLDASLYEFVGFPDYVGAVCTADELRAEVDRFARMLLGYAVTGEQL
jgi:hypothetical protein